MPQENKDRNNAFSVLIWPSRSPKVKPAMALYLRGKFHAFYEKVHDFATFGGCAAIILISLTALSQCHLFTVDYSIFNDFTWIAASQWQNRLTAVQLHS